MVEGTIYNISADTEYVRIHCARTHPADFGSPVIVGERCTMNFGARNEFGNTVPTLETKSPLGMVLGEEGRPIDESRIAAEKYTLIRCLSINHNPDFNPDAIKGWQCKMDFHIPNVAGVGGAITPIPDLTLFDEVKEAEHAEIWNKIWQHWRDEYGDDD